MDKLKTFLEKGYKTGDGSNFFRIGPLKLVADGTLGARTAALSEPYDDDLNNLGICTYDRE